MIEIVSNFYRSLLVRWVDGVCRFALLTLLSGTALTIAAATYSAAHFSISTATSDMLSPELDFRRHARSMRQAFPQFSDNILIVIDAESPDLADDSADQLAANLRGDLELFGDVYDLAGAPFFRKNGLLYLDTVELSALSDRLSQAQPFLGVLWRDPSLVGFFGMLGLAIDENLKNKNSAPIDIARAMKAVGDVAEAQISSRFGLLSWRSVMTGVKADASDYRRFILIQPKLDFASLSPAADVIAAVRARAAALSLDPDHGIRVRLTGSAALEHEELKSVEQGIGYAGFISLILVIGLLAAGFRSFRLVVATLVALVFGLIWTAGFAFAAIGTLNLISVAFAVLFIGLSVDFGIHFGLRYKESINCGMAHDESLRDATNSIGGAISLCAVTAAVGFYSFLPTDYLGLAELGLIAGTGMFIALVANLTILPAVLTLMPLGPASVRSQTGLFEGQAIFLRKRARIVSIAAGLLGLAGLGIASQAQFDFDPLNLKNPETESVSTLIDLIASGRTNLYSITILAADIEKATQLAKKLKGLDVVESAVTLSDYVPKNQDEKLAIIDSMAFFLAPALSGAAGAATSSGLAVRRQAVKSLLSKLDRLRAPENHTATKPEAARLATALHQFHLDDTHLSELERRLIVLLPNRVRDLKLLLNAQPVTLDDLPTSLKIRHIASDGRARIEVQPKEYLRDREALKRFVDAVRAIAPDAAGTPVVILEAGEAVVTAFVEAAATALIAIVILLVILFRSVRDVGLVFAPLALAAILTVAASVLVDLPFNFANVIVLPLLFGLGVANGIHLVARERDELGVAAVMATSTPRAVVFSALTTVGSFASLAISDHPGTASMGVLLAIAIICALISSLVVLPALMVWGGPSRRMKTEP